MNRLDEIQLLKQELKRFKARKKVFEVLLNSDDISDIDLKIRYTERLIINKVSYHEDVTFPKYSNIKKFLDKKPIKVKMPPGFYLSKFITFLYSKKTRERVFEPALADMQNDYFSALDCGNTIKARWIHLRGLGNIVFTCFSQLSVSAIKIIIDIWKIS